MATLPPTLYDVTLPANTPIGPGLLNQPCTVVFTYSDGSHSDLPYSGTTLAWQAPNMRISSAVMNIEAGYTAFGGATGGTLTIHGNPGGSFAILHFAQV